MYVHACVFVRETLVHCITIQSGPDSFVVSLDGFEMAHTVFQCDKIFTNACWTVLYVHVHVPELYRI